MTHLRLSLPQPGWGVTEAIVTRWTIEPGAAVEPGDVLLSLRVNERVRPLATVDATKLLSRNWEVDPLGLGPDALMIEVLAGEPGRLETIHALPGERIGIGTLLGTLTTVAPQADPAPIESGGVGHTTPEDLPEFRAFAEVLELSGELDAIS